MLGISIAIFYPNFLDAETARVICLAAFVLYFWIVIRIYQKSSGKRVVNLKAYAGVIGLSAVFFAGILRVESNTSSNNPDHIIHHDSIDYFKAVISTALVEKENSWKAESVVDEIHSRGHWKVGTGRILLYFSKKDFKNPPRYGDILLVKGQPQLVPPQPILRNLTTGVSSSLRISIIKVLSGKIT
jgi:competence protein ComEC